MKQYKKLDIKPKTSFIGLDGFNFCNRISAKYSIFRKSATLPVLIFLRLFGTRGVNKITNINRMKLIKNYFRLNLAPYLKVISQLESILNHSKKSNIQAVTNTVSRHEYFKNTLLFLKNVLQYSHAKKSLKTVLHNGRPRLISNLLRIKNNLKGRNDKHYSLSQKENLWEQYPVVEYKSPTILQQVDSFVSNRTLFSINKSLYNEPFRRTFVGQASRLSQNASQSDNPTTSRRTSFKMGVDNLYFHTQRMIEQEVEEIKRIVVETKEVTEEKSLSTHSLKDDIDKQMKQHLDINRLSDQVYQNIERRIRIEKERRGL